MNALLEMELEDLYEEQEHTETETAQQVSLRFQITDLNGANWAFRKLKALQQKMDENKELVAAETSRLESWLATQNGNAQRDIEYFESVVTEYFLSERAKDSKFKLNTPYGKVSTRKSKKWIYYDESAIKSLKEANLPDFIQITESLIKEDLKKAEKSKLFLVTDSGQLVTADGEIIDGISVTNTESISIKVD